MVGKYSRLHCVVTPDFVASPEWHRLCLDAYGFWSLFYCHAVNDTLSGLKPLVSSKSIILSLAFPTKGDKINSMSVMD